MVNPKKEQLIKAITAILIERGIVYWTGTRFGLCTGLVMQQLAIGTIWFLWDHLLSGGRRIHAAIRERDENNSIVSVVLNEIANMGLETFNEILDCIAAVIDFIKYLLKGAQNVSGSLFSRGAQFSGNMQHKALTFTSYSSSRR